jgi:nitrous oxidase accessory protein NosD
VRAVAAGVALLAALEAFPAAPPAPRQTVDARDAGALGDGIRDDAAALQAALDRLGASGGVLRLPAGTYVIGRPLVVRGDAVTVAGEGALVQAASGFAAGSGRAALIRNEGKAVQRGLSVTGVELDGGGVATAGIWLERVREATVRGNTVKRIRGAADGAGIVLRSLRDDEGDAGEVTVASNVVETGDASPGIVVRRVVNCLVTGNRVTANGTVGAHGIDLTLSQGCTVSDNTVLAPDVGVIADDTNHLQVLGNYVFSPRTGFRAVGRPGGKAGASNAIFVNNRVLTGGVGFVVRGSGMVLVANYAAFLRPGPAVWVQRGGTHDAVVANNASVSVEGGIRFDADDGVVAANVPISNASTGIEVNGARVAVTGNAVNASPIGIRLGDAAAACTVVGNTLHGAKDAPLVLGGRDHRVRDNSGASLEAGPGAAYGSGELEVTAARSAVASRFADDRYLVHVEWVGDPGGREWIADKTAAGFVITLPAAPPHPVRARWLAIGIPPRD